MGRKYSVTSGRFQGAKFHRLLSGDEFEEMAVASRPVPASRDMEKQPLKVRIHWSCAALWLKFRRNDGLVATREMALTLGRSLF